MNNKRAKRIQCRRHSEIVKVWLIDLWSMSRWNCARSRFLTWRTALGWVNDTQIHSIGRATVIKGQSESFELDECIPNWTRSFIWEAGSCGDPNPERGLTPLSRISVSDYIPIPIEICVVFHNFEILNYYFPKKSHGKSAKGDVP